MLLYDVCIIMVNKMKNFGSYKKHLQCRKVSHIFINIVAYRFFVPYVLVTQRFDINGFIRSV